MGERLTFRHLHPQELTQGAPTFSHLIHQQPVDGDVLLYLLVVPLKDLDGVPAILEVLAEGLLPDELVVQPRGMTEGCDHLVGGIHSRVYRVPGALVPFLGISEAEQDLRVWIHFHKFFVEGGSGPVHSSLVSCEELIPVDGLSPHMAASHIRMCSGCS